MKRLLIFLLLSVVGILPAQAAAELLYRGEQTIYRDTVWEGEVLVDGILTVAPGATLEIRPGTRVSFTRFDSNGDGIGEHEMFVQGALLAVGTEDEPIRFTSAETAPSPGDWGAINMMASLEGNRLENCQIEYGYRGFHAHFAVASLFDSTFRRNVRGIQFQESTVDIERCRISGNRNGIQFRDSTVHLRDTEIAGNYWGLRCVYSEVSLENCRIDGNLVNGANLRDSQVRAVNNRIGTNRRGLYLQRSRGEIAGNHLVGNSEHGILLEEFDGALRGNRVAGNGRAGVRVIDGDVTIVDNALAGNGEFDMVNDGTRRVVARRNWWGATDAAEISRRIRDRRDRVEVGPVDAAAPLLEEPINSLDGSAR